MKLKNILKSLVNILFPLKCAYCEKDIPALSDRALCDICANGIKHNPKPNCVKCGRPMAGSRNPCAECRKSDFRFSSAYSACIYDGVVKELIHRFKYGGRISLSRLLSKIMVDFILNNPKVISGIGVITFVPLGQDHFSKRGFNQSRVLAGLVSNQLDIPLVDILKKIRRTRSQNELSRDERLINLAGAFIVKKGAIKVAGKKILLVDDVMTTGATLNECAKVLLGAGAKEVRCFTLARGV